MKILVVDDERDVKILFEQRFRKEIRKGDVTFVFAFSGEEAVETLDKLNQEAVLILSDINMPGMSGLELLEHIKKNLYKPPPVVMMITAYGDEQNRKAAERLGADAFLTKPLDFKLLKNELLNI
ncbi:MULTISPECIES: response regulator [Lutimonas]|uniref:response regulator n=1 Tax=Lutimonas TaxID=449810 RepID=UPI001CD80700|nr:MULTISPECIES: response regulator [Lutimonas]MCA0930866.1 response regulator [Lutimonas saemankumensis]WKK66644.1 response regulator [Lutimonas sp. YSD2104]